MLIPFMLLFVQSSLPASYQKSIRWWWLGLFLQPLGFFLIAMRGQISPVFSVVLAHTLVAGSLACYAIAMRMFIGVRQRRVIAGALVLTAGIIAVTYDNMYPRVILLSFTNTLLLLFGARAIYRQELKASRVSQVVAGVFVIIAISMAGSAAYNMISPSLITANVFAMGWPTILSYAMVSLLPTVGTIGFLLMCTEHSQKELERTAREDSLTGTYNRRALAEFGIREIARARRHGTPLSVILIDIDNFKRINDELGHAAGDLALVETVRRLKKNLRSEDCLGRMGGEEFLILLPDTNIEQAQVLANRIQEDFNNQPMLLLEQSRLVTLSGGITLLSAHDYLLNDMLRRADKAMYSAKALGRNRMQLDSASTTL